MAHLLFAMSLGGTQNGDVRFLTCVPALCMFAFCVIFAYCSTLSKTVTRRRIIFCIGVFMDMSLAGFVGMLSASSSGLNELGLVVIPFMCAGYVSIFCVDWLAQRAEAAWKLVGIITPLVIVPFWIISLFFTSFKPVVFLVSVVLCAVSVFSYVTDLMTMKYLAQRADVDAAYEWFTAIIAVFDMLIAIGAAGGAVGATTDE